MSSVTLLERIAADKNKDEAAWFEARRRGVTATDIAQLEKGGAAVRAKLLAEKRSGERTFFGNAYTAWGLEREPVLAEWAHDHFGHVASDVTFHAPDNVRHLATPDLLHLKDGLVTIGEIKTSKHDLTVGSPAFVDSHYMAQMQWQMYVIGDDVMECLFLHELRLGDPGEFVAGQMGHAWVERDNGHIAELVALADEFLDELDAEPDDPNDYSELVRERIAIDNRIADLQSKRGAVDAQILARIGDRNQFAITTPFGKVSWSTPKPSERFDSTRFKAEQPDVFKDYLKLTQAKPSLRITAIKEEANDVL